MNTPNKYHIAHVSDFLKIPADRMADCLAEFADFLKVAQAVAQEVDAVCGSDGVLELSEWGWIDDGRKDWTIEIAVANRGDGDAKGPTPDAGEEVTSCR